MSNDVPGDKEVLLSVPEACRRLNISRMTFYRLIRTDQIRTAKVGHLRRVRPSELERFAAAMERATS